MRRFGPSTRKLALTAHIVVSVGWLGAVNTYLALALMSLRADDVRAATSLLAAMNTLIQVVILPLNLASLATGVISGLGSPWGLVRHYWVLFKLLLNLVTTVVLVLYARQLQSVADPADPTHAVHSAAALVVLLVATALAVYKPKGLVRPRARRQPPIPGMP